MGKNPAFQFYPSDWTRDLDDQDLEVEGAWIRIVCRLWWSETKGEATKPLKEWARILRKTEQKTIKIFQILIEKHIADGNILDNQNITIISRRMKRSVEISKLRYEVGLKGGNPVLKKTEKILDNQSSNQNARSSSSSSTSIKKESIKKESRKLSLTDEEWLKAIKANPAYKAIDVEAEQGKCAAWCMTNGKVMSRRRLVNWLNRAEKPMGGNYGNRQGDIFSKRPIDGETRGRVGEPPGGSRLSGPPRKYVPEPVPELTDEQRAEQAAKLRQFIQSGLKTL